MLTAFGGCAVTFMMLMYALAEPARRRLTLCAGTALTMGDDDEGRRIELPLSHRTRRLRGALERARDRRGPDAGDAGAREPGGRRRPRRVGRSGGCDRADRRAACGRAAGPARDRAGRSEARRLRSRG